MDRHAPLQSPEEGPAALLGAGGRGCARRDVPGCRRVRGSRKPQGRATNRPDSRGRPDLVRHEGRPRAVPDRGLRRLPGEADQREGVPRPGSWLLCRPGGRVSSEVKPKILVVDDVPQNVRLLEAVLVSNGYVVSSASSGPEALEMVAAELPDLVLLDIQMPGMNGYEVCRRLPADPSTRFLPVVMVTSSDTEVRVNAIEAEADDFITKPFDQQELLGRVRSLVRIKQYHDTIESQAAELTELILSQGEEILESHRREIAVLFADLRGWTAFSVNTEPEEVMGVIRDFHTAMGNLIVQFEATVGWFAGDGLMVWFNDPIPCSEPAARAVRMALDMRSAMAELTSRWRRRGHELDFSVGIGLGYATLGRIGFDGRYDYGAVGTVMNLASRLCDEAEHGQILVSERVFSEVEHLVEAEPAGELTLKGFAKPVAAFSIAAIAAAEVTPAGPGP